MPSAPVTAPTQAPSGTTATTEATTAHLQVRTSDGAGLLYLDGQAQGSGAIAQDVAPGQHTIVVIRDGYDRFETTRTLAANDTWSETITLRPVRDVNEPLTAPVTAARPFEGLYGGFGLGGLLGIGGLGTELDIGCSTLGAASCDTGTPAGGGAFGYVGWSFDPVGFELMLGGAADATRETAHFDGVGRSGTLPLSMPARDEKYTFFRVGGLAAVRARASIQGARWRATIAGGVGLSYKQMLMKREATTTDGTNRADLYVPNSVGYLSPAVTVEGAVQLRLKPTMAVSLGLLMWAENASIAGTNSVAPQADRVLAGGSAAPTAIATPQYHLATGPQVFLGPFVGMQFGP